MSGVIDDNRQQWEHCMLCAEFVHIENLGYLKPSAEHPYGLDLCVQCTDRGIRSQRFAFEDIQPAPDWVPVVINPTGSTQ